MDEWVSIEQTDRCVGGWQVGWMGTSVDKQMCGYVGRRMNTWICVDGLMGE